MAWAGHRQADAPFRPDIDLLIPLLARVLAGHGPVPVIRSQR
jgi:hypothetical protein